MQTLVITIILFVVAIILFKVFKPKKVSLEYSYDSEEPIGIEDKKEVVDSTPIVVQELKVKRVIRKVTKKKEISAEGTEEGGVIQ